MSILSWNWFLRFEIAENLPGKLSHIIYDSTFNFTRKKLIQKYFQ